MRARLPPRRERGFVMLVILSLLVVLTVVASIVYQRASEQATVSSALRRQSIAQDRAIQAMRRGLIDANMTPRPAYLLAGLAAGQAMPCQLPNPEMCPVVAQLGPFDNGAATALDQGGGMQYTVQFHYWTPPVGGVPPFGAPVLVVHGIGFEGYAAALHPPFRSEVLVEVSLGTPNAGGCVGYCGAGL